MKKPNKHIDDYLDYYCKIENPEYAVLLKGPWGSGKTWFIKEYIKKLEARGQKKIYVSLYGIGSTSEIEDLFYQELHPILSSKGMSIAGKIVKGLLRTTVKIDLDGNSGSSDAAINSQIPEINLPEYLKDAQDRILIFDDLERCKMSDESVLGYINYFVEHQGLKVIIIANEDEILNKEDEGINKSYRQIKEKLIGKTFRIETDFDSVLNGIVEGIQVPQFQKLMKGNINSIKNIYISSQFENLRHLKQSISDFERFMSFIPRKMRKKTELMFQLMNYFLVFSFEIKHGKIIHSQIADIKKESIYKFVDDRKVKNKSLKEIIEKYSTLDFYDLILTDNQWSQFFDRSVIDEKSVEESLLSSIYYQDKNTPDWIKLWHFWDLNDKKFELLLSRVSVAFEKRKYLELGEISHVFGLLLHMSDIGLYAKKRKDIINEFKRYIDYLKKEGLLLNKQPFALSFHNDAYRGLQFHSIDKEDFKKSLLYADDKIEESKVEDFPDAGRKLLEAMRKDMDKFVGMICPAGSVDKNYHRTPIFKYIDSEVFIANILLINPENRRRVAAALSERYKYDDVNEELIGELSWLRKVRNKLIKESRNRVGKLSGHILERVFGDHIDSIIKKLTNKKRMMSSKAD